MRRARNGDARRWCRLVRLSWTCRPSCRARGVTCQRWNWRQGTRTRITEALTALWFTLERLEPMPVEALLAAGRQLAEDLVAIGSGRAAASTLYDLAHPEGRPRP